MVQGGSSSVSPTSFTSIPSSGLEMRHDVARVVGEPARPTRSAVRGGHEHRAQEQRQAVGVLVRPAHRLGRPAPADRG